VITTEQMGALCGAHLIEELAYRRSFVPSCTDKDNNRGGIALPCENPEGTNGKHILMTTLYSHERYSHEEVEEGIEEMKPSLFSADASSSQHRPCSWSASSSRWRCFGVWTGSLLGLPPHKAAPSAARSTGS